MFNRIKQMLGGKNRPLLKQSGDLTLADFATHPVWIQCHVADYEEPWYDDTDEETFRPWFGQLPAGPEEGMLLVKAKLTLANGRTLDGFLTPQHEGEPLDFGTVQPQMFLPSGERRDFWDGAFKRKDEERERFYRELQLDAMAIFPIHFAAEPGLATAKSAAQSPAFAGNV